MKPEVRLARRCTGEGGSEIELASFISTRHSSGVND